MASLNVLEHCQVTPPPTTVVAEKSLPLTFFDLPWVHFPPNEHLLFYEFPIFTTHFMHTTIPSLKHSLSLTLKHFYPLAGNLIFPSDSSKPEIRYIDGDSVSLTFAKSTNDFDNLIGNHARNANEFRPLVPQLPPMSTMLSGELVVPLMAIQVTLFPNSGICIGFTSHHVAADGKAFIDFIRSWASITKLGGDEVLVAGGSLPFHDRTVIKDPKGIETIFWSLEREKKFDGSPPQNLPPDMVLATFVMSHICVQNLKKCIPTQFPTLSHVSTVTVTCAYAWVCTVKARARSGEEVGEAELEHLLVLADCRGRLDPPIPPTYFGNCLAPCLATAKSTQLTGEDGFLIAAEAVAKAFQERLSNGEGVLKGAEKWTSEIASLKKERLTPATMLSKLAIYDIDFGWGKPKKSELISIGAARAMSLHECRDAAEGDLEIGLCFPRIKMEAFAASFADGLKVF